MDTEEAAQAQRLYGKLAKQYAWLDGNVDHSSFNEREAIFFRTLEVYEAVCRDIEAPGGPPSCPSA